MVIIHVPQFYWLKYLIPIVFRKIEEGEVLIEASRFRSQEKNREDARNRMIALIVEAAKPPPPPRRKTKPTKGSVERRLKSKSGRADVKKMRQRIKDD